MMSGWVDGGMNRWKMHECMDRQVDRWSKVDEPMHGQIHKKVEVLVGKWTEY